MESLIILISFLVIELVLYFKLKSYKPVKFPLIAVVYLFGIIVNVDSIGSGLPFTPTIQIFLILFESVVFLITSMDYYIDKKKKDDY